MRCIDGTLRHAFLLIKVAHGYTMSSAKSSPTSSSAISAQYRLWRAGYLMIGVYAAVRREPDGGVWAAGRPSMASSTAPRRGSDVLLTTLDHPGAGVARDGGRGQRENTRITFFKIHRVSASMSLSASHFAIFCKEPLHISPQAQQAGL